MPKEQPTVAASTPLIEPSRWAAGSFQLAAGCCMLQPSEDQSYAKVVVVYDTYDGRYFLPRGRKDVGESLEQAAFREGYEESGFRPQPLPLLLKHRQPASPEQKKKRKEDPMNTEHWLTTTEPVYITTIPVPRHSYEYTCFWYAASLPLDAVREQDTGMDDEKSYVGRLMSYEEALSVLHDPESFVVWYTYDAWKKTRDELREEKKEETSKAALAKPTNVSEMV